MSANTDWLGDALTYRQLDHWTRKGLLRPEGGRGSGQSREWPHRERKVALLMARLVKAGLGLELAHRVARDYFENRGPWAIPASLEIAPGLRIVIDHQEEL